MNTYFIPADGIDREVIQSDIVRYLGNDALVRPGTYEDPQTRTRQKGYFITAYRKLTSAMIADLKGDSERWRAENAAMSLRVESPKPAASSIPGASTISTPQLVKHLKPNRKYLPLYINGRFIEACADFGSDGNILRKDLADSLGLEIMSNVGDCPLFRLPTGKLLAPCGRTMITCHFPDEKQAAGSFEFFLFQDFVIPLILGKRFLRTTRTLDQHFYRLKDRAPPLRVLPLVAFLGDDHAHQKEQISFWLNGEKLESTPDTGSDLNLISLDFALQRNYSFDPHNRQKMQFADGSTAISRGCITLHVSFGGDGSSPITVLELVDHSSSEIQSPSIGGKVNYGPQTAIAAEFHVLEDLLVEVLLGVDVLATVDAFVQHNRHFKFTPASGLHDLFLTEQLNGFARSLIGHRTTPVERGVADRVQQLLIERAQLIAQADALVERSSHQAWSLSEAERTRQAALDQQTHDLYQARIDQINQEIRTRFRQQQASNPASQNLGSPQEYVPPLSNGGAVSSNLSNNSSRPFVSAAPPNYQPGAPSSFMPAPIHSPQPGPSNYYPYRP